MLWEHPRLAESLVQSFRSTNKIPERSLTDGLLQQINRTAYERDFSKNSEGEYPAWAKTTFETAATKYGGLLNYPKEGKGMTLSKFTEAPRLLESKTFSWDIACPFNWEIDYKSTDLEKLDFNGTTAWGLVWEGKTYSFMPYNHKFKGWNSWIYDDHQQCCDESPTLCLSFDTRNHVRVKYRAKITPDPLDSAYYDATKGTRIGEIYSQESLSEGIISHQIIIEAEVETTAGDLGWFGISQENYTGEAIATFGILIRNLTTGASDEVQFDIVSGDSVGSYNYAFPNAGLYSIFVYLKSIEVNGILVSTPLKEKIQDYDGSWIYASHPIRTLVYVSPSPDWDMSYIPVVDSPSVPDDAPESKSVLIDENGNESEEEEEETPVWPFLALGGLGIVALTMAR